MKVFVFVWLFCIFWWLIQDAANVLTYHLMYKTNYNNINNVVGIQEKK